VTKGKYAAKAAGQRAAQATDTVAELKAQLAAERTEHAREVVDLKTQVQQLAGRLTREVRDLSAAEIARAAAEARELVKAARDEQHAKALEVARLLLTLELGIGYEDWTKVCETLGIDPGQSISHYDVPRAARRLTNERAKHAMAQFEQNLRTGAPAAESPGRAK
jgi:hypothetical protein